MKPAGNRRLQPVVNEFFYWLRASVLRNQPRRLLVGQPHARPARDPLEEKMALFWHGHFASNEGKVRDYRKLLQQVELFQKHGTGNFRNLMIAVAQDPAMLSFLDAGVNVKGASNENFAREIMEMFTMGVGHYTEKDIREAARAFTGWNYVDLKFVVNKEQHDDGEKTFLGKTGKFDGVDIIDIIMQQPVTADFIAGKIYRYLRARGSSPELQKQLGAVLRDSPITRSRRCSKRFSCRAISTARRRWAREIKSPVELAVSTYHKLGLKNIPGVPDFNSVTGALGQHLFSPPTVAGWAQRAELDHSGSAARARQFRPRRAVPRPSTSFRPIAIGPAMIRRVAERMRQGMDISAATKPDTKAGEIAESNMAADRDEEFNTRYGSFRGWQMAIERVKPIPRDTAQIDLAAMVTRRTLKQHHRGGGLPDSSLHARCAER